MAILVRFITNNPQLTKKTYASWRLIDSRSGDGGYDRSILDLLRNKLRSESYPSGRGGSTSNSVSELLQNLESIFGEIKVDRQNGNAYTVGYRGIYLPDSASDEQMQKLEEYVTSGYRNLEEEDINITDAQAQKDPLGAWKSPKATKGVKYTFKRWAEFNPWKENRKHMTIQEMYDFSEVVISTKKSLPYAVETFAEQVGYEYDMKGRPQTFLYKISDKVSIMKTSIDRWEDKSVYIDNREDLDYDSWSMLGEPYFEKYEENRKKAREEYLEKIEAVALEIVDK